MAGDAIELATTGAAIEGEGATVVGALVAILLAGWFPVCCWLRLPADELALVVVVEVVEAEAVDDAATLVSGWVLKQKTRLLPLIKKKYKYSLG